MIRAIPVLLRFKEHSLFNVKRLSPILLLYGVSGLVLLNYYRYQINPDGVSYISIARKYLAGEWTDAINGVWGPLLSWLLTPFLLTEMEPLLAVKVLSLLLGFFLIVGVERLLNQFEMSETVRGAVMLSMIPITLYFSLTIITPDLLLTCTLVYYFSLIFGKRYREDQFAGLKCGLLGATAYFAKGYGFPFFLSHFLLFNGLHFKASADQAQRSKVLRNLVTGLSVFFLLSIPWITVLSHKYGELTFSTAGKYNRALVGPDSEGFFYGQPHYQRGFLAPPNETAVSEWEDPSLHELEHWSPWDSWDSFLYQIKLTVQNMFHVLMAFESFSWLSLLILAAAFWHAVRGLYEKQWRYDFIFPLATVILYSSGFTLFHVEDRYLWINWVLLLLMGGSLMMLWGQREWMNPVLKRIAVLLLVTSFVLVPIEGLFRTANSGREVYDLSRQLAEMKIQGNIASNAKWHESMFISYYLGSQYYGVPRNDISGGLLEELKKYNIDYYFVWDGLEGNRYVLPDSGDIKKGEVSGLKVYFLADG